MTPRQKYSRKAALIATLAVGATALLAGCTSDADRVNENLSTKAEQFQIDRRIVFYNGITDSYMLEITGKCSVEPGAYLEVICKVGPDDYYKHFLGKSDNVTWFAEQIEGVDASEYTYTVIFKPESILPHFETETTPGDTGD